MTPDELKTWVAIVLGTLSLAGTAWSWLQQRGKDNSGKIDELTKSQQETKTKLALLEQQIGQMPTKERQHSMELTLTKVEGEVSTLAKSVSIVERTATRIEEHLLAVNK